MLREDIYYQIFINLVVTKVQNEVSAQTYKKRGNKHFMAGQYAEAIECYSKAIELGSEVKAEELSTFHQNRAAAEEHMVRLATVIISDLQSLINL